MSDLWFIARAEKRRQPHGEWIDCLLMIGALSTVHLVSEVRGRTAKGVKWLTK